MSDLLVSDGAGDVWRNLRTGATVARTVTEPPAPPPTGTRGPTGQWPTHTPAYTTAATVTTNGTAADLQAKINAASSGAVIEHPGSIASVTLTGGSTGWAQNVLIRPPVGQRADYAMTGNVEAHHLTVAGYRITGGNVRVRNCTRGGLAWMETDSAGQLFVDANGTATTDVFIYELAFIGTTSWTSTGDLMQYRGLGATLTRPLFVGFHVLGPTKTTGSGAHNDTIQTFSQDGGKVIDAEFRDSVIFAAGDKAMQGDVNSEGTLIDNCLIYEPSKGDDWVPWPGGSAGAYGSHAITGGMSIGGTIRDSTIVGSIGSTVAVIEDSVGYDSNLESASTSSSGNTALSGNPAPPVLPSAMTHAYLDTVWST